MSNFLKISLIVSLFAQVSFAPTEPTLEENKPNDNFFVWQDFNSNEQIKLSRAIEFEKLIKFVKFESSSSDNVSFEEFGAIGGVENISKSDLYSSDVNFAVSKTMFSKLPIGLPVEGHINSQFGYRKSPFSRKIKMHSGIDFAVPYGSAVRSTGDGEVVSVKRHPSYGLMIEVAHGASLVTRFAHLSKAHVKVGDHVCRGELLGLVGSSGRSTGAHLHYEILIEDKATNPIQMVELGQLTKGLL